METFFSEYPDLSVKFKVPRGDFNEERFCLVLGGNEAFIEASSHFIANYAKSQLLAGIKSNRLGDFIGENVPQVGMRTLWVEEGVLDFIESKSLGDRIDEIVGFGYNTLIFASNDESCQSVDLQTISLCFSEIRKKGIKVAIRASSLDVIELFCHFCDYIFCKEGDLFALGYAPAQKNPTPFERAEYELALLQKVSPLPILYYAKPGCSFLLKLLEVATAKSTILFDSYTHGVLSPIFTELSRRRVVDATRLLPILTFCQIELADGGYFSDAPLLQIENVLGRQKNGRFAGAGCRIQRISTQGALAQMPLWVFGQRMWRALNVHVLFETWVDCYRPEWQELLTSELIQLIHALFCHKSTANMEKAAARFVELAELLGRYRTKFRFQKPDAHVEELSWQLLYLQQALKEFFIKVSTKTAVKIPLALQNYEPLEFLPLQKSSTSVK